MQKYTNPIPKITTEQMIEVDRLMIEEYHIELIQMMENAGRGLAILAKEKFLNGNPLAKNVTILAGTGGNGGGALVCARRLANWGAKVQVFMTAEEDKMTPIPLHQLNILKKIGIPIQLGNRLKTDTETDLIIDGIIGYSISGDPYGLPKEMIDWANAHSAAVLSLDTPSGLDLTTAKVHNPTVKADATLTLALPKQGLFETSVQSVRGELFLADISVPPGLYAQPSLGLRVPFDLFASADIVKID